MSLESRFGKIAHVTSRAELGSTSAPSTKGKGIRIISSFADVYDLGKEVMPSTHSYMKVQFGRRKEDGLEVVIKLRFKPNCFRSREDERGWRHNTDFMLNLPENVGIARLYDVFEDPKAFYVVMEKVSGADLFETLEAEGKVSVSVAKTIIRHLISSLVHLHSHNGVHKDLKLENVMLACNLRSKKPTSDSVKVIDFDTLEEWTPTSSTAKDVVGTDQYISPEAYAGRYSPLSDIFAVGVMAYRFLTGRFPFHNGMFDDEAGENWVGSPKMAQIRRRLKVAKIDFGHHVFQENPMAADLVMRMLAYSELHRPTAHAALEHPWFQEGLGGDSGKDAKDSGDAWLQPSRDEFEDLIDDGIIICE